MESRQRSIKKSFENREGAARFVYNAFQKAIPHVSTMTIVISKSVDSYVDIVIDMLLEDTETEASSSEQANI